MFLICSYIFVFIFVDNKTIVKEIKLIGFKNSPKESIDSICKSLIAKKIINLDLKDLQKTFLQIPWIEKAKISKELYGMINVCVFEKTPLAYYGDSSQLILCDGSVIKNNQKKWQLPLVIGENSEKNVKDILEIVSNFPKVRDKILAYVFVRKYRWNLVLIENINVKLPKENVVSAIELLNSVIDSIDLSTISNIDLRIFKKIIIRPIGSIV